LPDIITTSLPASIVVFAIAAVAVWRAGTRIAVLADEIARRTGLGEALTGLVLLAGVTSLPEVATSFSAALDNDAKLAVNNLLCSIAMQLAVLALADAFIHQRALTSVVPDPVVILQGALNIVLLAVVAVATIVGDSPLLGAGFWSWFLFCAAIASLWKLSRARGRQPWLANKEIAHLAGAIDEPRETPGSTGSAARLAAGVLVSALTILIAGWMVATTGGAIAELSGLGSSFVGVAFVAIATSLPEASTVFASIRRGLYTMAISDILGTNILNVALLFGVDLIAGGAPVLGRVGEFATTGTLLGILVTGILLVGLAERRDRTVWRMGVDSAAVLVIYAGGLVILYHLRDIG